LQYIGWGTAGPTEEEEEEEEKEEEGEEEEEEGEEEEEEEGVGGGGGHEHLSALSLTILTHSNRRSPEKKPSEDVHFIVPSGVLTIII
jgi:hypothetical protein